MNKIMIPETDLALAPVGLGCAAAGLAWDGADADRIFDAYVDMGGNLIDTARVYSDWVPPEIGRSERVIGDWLQRSGKRDSVLISTKGGHPKYTSPSDDLHISRMSDADMRYDIEQSLKTLRVDTIDLYFYHRDDPKQSVEEEIETMENFRREGKLRCYGCSNWTAERILEADAYCKAKGYRGFAADQALLNLGLKYMNPMDDDTLTNIEGSLYDYHRTHLTNLAMPYMGVASGFFHHYAAKGAEAVKGSNYATPENLQLAERCVQLTKEYGCSLTQAVLGFFAVQDFPCVPLYAPKSPAQIVEALETFGFAFKRADYEL